MKQISSFEKFCSSVFKLPEVQKLKKTEREQHQTKSSNDSDHVPKLNGVKTNHISQMKQPKCHPKRAFCE